jgi:lipid-binding SYLF domain-containing protein
MVSTKPKELNMSHFTTASLALTALLTTACGGTGWKPETPSEPPAVTAEARVNATVARFQRLDPKLQNFVEQSHGYAVFPSVGKGAMGFGVAHGRGAVYEEGALIGRTSLTQLSVGFAFGGQEYAQIVFFENEAALSDFTGGNFELGAQASAVAVTSGASADASYDRGVAIFTVARGGLMYEAAVAGQKFTYEAI